MACQMASLGRETTDDLTFCIEIRLPGPVCVDLTCRRPLYAGTFRYSHLGPRRFQQRPVPRVPNDGVTHEAYISAERACSQAQARFSRSQSNERRHESSGPSSCQGPQAPFSLISVVPTLKTRADFLALRSAPSVRKRAFVLAGGATARSKPSSFRIGFTVTKKLGNAVVRNRIKRRLRHAVAAVMADCAVQGHDYVVIGRAAAVDQPFEDLIRDFRDAFEDVNAGRSSGRSVRHKRPRRSTS